MTKKEFLEMIDNVTIDKRKVGKISKLYDSTLPEYVQKVISCTKKSLFFDDERRLLAFSEIESASEEYDVDFIGKNMIPLIDCFENDFIVYHLVAGVWSKFNVVDGTVYKKKTSTLKEVL